MKKIFVLVTALCIISAIFSSCDIPSNSKDVVEDMVYEEYIGTWYDDTGEKELTVNEVDDNNIIISLYFYRTKSSFEHIFLNVENGVSQFSISGNILSGMVRFENDQIVVSIESTNQDVELGDLYFIKKVAGTNRYERFCAVQIGMTAEQVDATYGEKLEFADKDDQSDDIFFTFEYSPYQNFNSRVIFSFHGGVLTSKLQLCVARAVSNNEYLSISRDTFDMIQQGTTYGDMIVLVGGEDVPQWEYHNNDEVVKSYYFRLDNGWYYLTFTDDILTDKGRSEA